MQRKEVRKLFIDLFSGWKGLLHILFWVSHLLIRTFFSRYHSEDLWQNFIVEMSELPLKILIAYFGIYLIERFIINQNLSNLLSGLTISFLLAWFFKKIHDLVITGPIYLDNGYSINFNFWNFSDGVSRLIYVYPTVAGIIALTFTIEWFLKVKRNQELEIINTENELKYLKSQIQPHFLFNTLNNLYSLSLDNSEETPEVILQLSELLSFMIYQADKPLIPLRDELELIQNLYNLESMRSSQPVYFSFEKEIQDLECEIPPLILFPLAENAFKYGIGDDEGGSSISFKLLQNDDRIEFITTNQIKREVKNDRKESQGFGLVTLQKRLDIIFSGKYELHTVKQNNEFISTLKLRGI